MHPSKIKNGIHSKLWLRNIKATGREYMNLVINKVVIKYRITEYLYWTLRMNRVTRSRINYLIDHYYSTFTESPNGIYEPCVVCIFEGILGSGGLADRIRGILSVYYFAKEKGIPFRIYFTNPFPLTDFLVPNKYDWRIESSKICHSRNGINIVYHFGIPSSFYKSKYVYKYINKRINKCNKQIHAYTNADISYAKDYQTLFDDLFKPSSRLQKSIDEQKELIGSKYISVSCRFLNSMKDSIEPYNHAEALSESERVILFDKLNETIQDLHDKYPTMKILINSDSKIFLNQYCDVDYVYIIPGNITHIDCNHSEYTYEKYEKTFLDFFMIANAELVFLIKSKHMYLSGYPYAASRVYGKRFATIRI